MLRKFLQYIDLRNDIEDFSKIHEEIIKGVTFKGTNLWVLVFAIIVASVGLNTNSPAVVIGAMLISPLMGPINGMGYSLATYDFVLFRKAISNFAFSVGASLLTSTLYFLLSPVSTAHSELLARTSPTIYDVIIALFGGFAGIVAATSKLKGNVIPGVAIATALMPPLCTAGYGLAAGEYNYFFGAIYLFTINTVFIGISALLASRIFRFPIAREVDAIDKKRINRWISAVIIVTALPSFYFGYVLVQKEHFAEDSNRFISNVTIFGGSYLIKSDVDPGKKTLTLVYGGNTLSNDDKVKIKAKLKDFNIEDANVEINQGFSSNIQELNEAQQLKNKLNATLTQLNKTRIKVDSLQKVSFHGQKLLSEIRPLFPQIKSCSYSVSKVFDASKKTDRNDDVQLVVFTIPQNSMTPVEKENVNAWLKARELDNNIIVYFFEETEMKDSITSTNENKR